MCHSVPCRILPQIKAVSGPWFLRDFAEYMHQERTQFDAHEVCTRIVKDLLAVAADRVDFYGPSSKPKPAAPTAFRRLPLHPPGPSEAETHLSRAKRFIKTCLETGNEDLLEVVVDKLTSTVGVAPEAARNRAKDVFLPLISSIADTTRGRPADHPVPHLGKLCETAVTLYTELISTQFHDISTASVSSMLQALILACQSHLVVSV